MTLTIPQTEPVPAKEIARRIYAEFAHNRFDEGVAVLEAYSAGRAAATVQELDTLKIVYGAYGPFQDWAQNYLDAGRWCGRHLADGVMTEMKERDAQLEEAKRLLVQAFDRIHTLPRATDTALANRIGCFLKP